MMDKRLHWLEIPAPKECDKSTSTAYARQMQLTKPPGSLGHLEAIAIRIAGLQATAKPNIKPFYIGIFAGDHGIATENISAFPSQVTGEMVKNFSKGGAAISVLAKELEATLDVVSLGLLNDPGKIPGVVNLNISPSTANFLISEAMTENQLSECLIAGKSMAERVSDNGNSCFIGGEMGIGNTTSASAIACALTGMSSDILVGPGTGLDPKGIAHKKLIIDQALMFHKIRIHEKLPLSILRCVGGFEIAGLVGAYIRCAQNKRIILVDGFIATVAALTAILINPSIRPWLIFTHCSAEPGHARLLDFLDAKPLINFEMRLGEASGAAVTAYLIHLACQLHCNMATFSEARVSNK